MSKTAIIELCISAVVFSACLVGYIAAKKGIGEVEPSKKQKRKKTLFFSGVLISAWFFVGVLITEFSGKEMHLAIHFDMFSERVDVFGISIASTTLIALGVSALLIVLLILFRIFVLPKFDADNPKGIQNVLELCVEAVENFTANAVGKKAGASLSPYMFSLAMFMIGCASTEMLGLRAPTSDLTCTFAMGLITFALLNIYGIRKHGFAGRLKSMGGAVPAMRPVMIPLKAVSDIAVPVSLACRLFGNMMGGMLVMELLKGVLGGFASGLPAIAGLYFNLFHPLIQIYIFITLSLTFIDEAME